MKELFTIFLDTSRERIKNPFIGAFIFAWIGFNWKPIVYLLLSNSTIEERIYCIENNYSKGINVIVWPLISAVFIVTLLPYLMLAFDKIASFALDGRKNNITRQQLLHIKSQQQLAEEESRLENIRSMYREKADLNKKIDSLEVQLKDKQWDNDSLLNQIENLRLENSKLKEINQKYESENVTEEEKVDFALAYDSFVVSDIYQYFRIVGKEISQSKTIPFTVDTIIIEKFKHNGVIKEYKQDGKTKYDFTKKGIYFWKEYILSTPIK